MAVKYAETDKNLISLPRLEEALDRVKKAIPGKTSALKNDSDFTSLTQIEAEELMKLLEE